MRAAAAKIVKKKNTIRFARKTLRPGSCVCVYIRNETKAANNYGHDSAVQYVSI